MGRLRHLWLLISPCILAFFITTAVRQSAAAPALTDSFCLDCHGDNTLAKTNGAGKEISLFVDKARLKASAHATNLCVSCHTDVTARHPDDNVVLQPVNCGTCHARQTESYGAS